VREDPCERLDRDDEVVHEVRPVRWEFTLGVHILRFECGRESVEEIRVLRGRADLGDSAAWPCKGEVREGCAVGSHDRIGAREQGNLLCQPGFVEVDAKGFETHMLFEIGWKRAWCRQRQIDAVLMRPTESAG
jgi:hypothetical protein